MKFRCPNCHKKLRSDSTKAGKVVRCPRCSGTFRIPVLQAGQEARVRAAAPSQPGNGRSRSPVLVATSAVVGVLAVSVVAAVLLWPRGNALREQGPGSAGHSEGPQTGPPDAGPSTHPAGPAAGPAVDAPRKAPSEPRDVDPQLPASGPAGNPEAPRARPPDAGPSTNTAGPPAGPSVDAPRKAPSEPREAKPSADQEPSDTPTALGIVKVLTRRGFREKPLVGVARVFRYNVLPGVPRKRERGVRFYSYLHSDTGVELKMTRNELALLGLRGPGNEYDFSASQDPKDLQAFLGIVADLSPKLRSACTDCLSEYGQKGDRSERVVGTVRVLVDKDGIHLKSAGIDK